MRLKWMVADVPAQQRAAFSTAQQQWASIALCDGFLGQIGGWDQHGRACILAAWRDEHAVERFMAHAHDAVTRASAQEQTYTALAVTQAEVLLHMPGAAPELQTALGTGGALRVADCRIHPGRRDHFVGAQLRVWAPGMAQAPGMLGGAFSAAGERRYLVTTVWTDEAAHEAYREGPFAALRAQARAAADLEEITGHQVVLESTWTVRPR